MARLDLLGLSTNTSVPYTYTVPSTIIITAIILLKAQVC